MTHLSNGFSLLEMAIVLIIVGLVSGMTLPLLTLQNQRTSVLKTRENQEYILNALASYYLQHKNLPCPANPKAKLDQFGLAEENCLKEKLYQGLIPFRTLGISEKWTKDGFGHYMTYVPEEKFLTEYQEDHTVCAEKKGALRLQEALGNDVISAKAHDFIGIVLVSHGPSGNGAFQGQGSLSRINIKTLQGAKLENANGDLTFSEFVKSADEEFDDILRWESRNQFMAHYVRLPCASNSKTKVEEKKKTPTPQDIPETTEDKL
ncbi:type II secretion system protein [Candidatus Bealeia paramacronuclearis]